MKFEGTSERITREHLKAVGAYLTQQEADEMYKKLEAIVGSTKLGYKDHLLAKDMFTLGYLAAKAEMVGDNETTQTTQG